MITTFEPWCLSCSCLPPAKVSTSGAMPIYGQRPLCPQQVERVYIKQPKSVSQMFSTYRLNPLGFPKGWHSFGGPLSLVVERRCRLLRDILSGQLFPSRKQSCQKESLGEVNWKDILFCITHSSFEYVKHWASSQGPRPKFSLVNEFCSQIQLGRSLLQEVQVSDEQGLNGLHLLN